MSLPGQHRGVAQAGLVRSAEVENVVTLRRRPRRGSRGGHRHRTVWTADDRRQVAELMVRWRHNVPGREWERRARRMGRTAAAARFSPPRTRPAPRSAEHEAACPQSWCRSAPSSPSSRPTPRADRSCTVLTRRTRFPAEAVELPDHEDIALPQDARAAVETRPVAPTGSRPPGRHGHRADDGVAPMVRRGSDRPALPPGNHPGTRPLQDAVGIVADARILGLDVDPGLVACFPYWELTPSTPPWSRVARPTTATAPPRCASPCGASARCFPPATCGCSTMSSRRASPSGVSRCG